MVSLLTGRHSGGENKPGGIAVDVVKLPSVQHAYQAEVYLADSNNDRVLKMAPEAVVVELGADAGLNKPAGLACDDIGCTFVADRNNDRLVVFDADGSAVHEMKADFNKPTGLDLISLVNSTGQVVDVEIYVTDRNNDRLVKLDAEGNVTMTIGALGKERGEFNKPMGVYVTGLGFIFVTDTNNDRLQKFDLQGNCIMVLEKGPDGKALFDKPVGVILDSKGDRLYVVDRNNDRVLVFGLPQE